MADTFTANYNLTKPEPGASRDSWGAKVNAALDKIDATMKANADLAAAALPKAGGAITGGLTVGGASTFSTNLTIGGAASVAGLVSGAGVNVQPAGVGGVKLVNGSSSERTGYVEFTKGDGTRAGYIGWAPTAGGGIDLVANTGFRYNFVGDAPTIAGATIYTTANFNPATKATLGAGVAVTFGDVTASRGNSTGAVYLGNTGIRYLFWDGGQYIMPGGELILNGTQVARHATAPRFTGVNLGTGQGYVYSDAGSHNVVLRAGDGSTGAPYTYAGVTPADKLLRTFEGASIYSDGDLRAKGRLIVGEGQTNSWVELRDTDEGTRYLHNNAGGIGFVGSGGDWIMRVHDDGNIWSKTWGWMSDRFAAKAERVSPSIGNGVRIEGNGGLGASGQAAYLSLWHGGVMHWQFLTRTDGQLALRSGDSGAEFVRFATSGAVWTSQLGDLNTRIEDRAYAHAVGQAGTRVAKTGDTMTGDLQITKAYPMARLLYPGVRDLAWQVRENGGLYLWDFTAGTWNVYIGPGGDVQTRQLGDLNTRIENRASAFAGERIARTGDTMSGDLRIQRNDPRLKMDANGVGGFSLLVHTDNRLYVQKEAGWTFQNNCISIGADGSIWTNQFGDLNTRIENRAYAWADARGSAHASARVAKTGDTMTGNLVISKEHAELQLVWGNVIRWGILVRPNQELQFRNADNDGVALALRPGGSIWTPAYGELDTYIRNIVNNKSIRLAYAGDLDNNWNLNNPNYAEPYGGGVLTSRYTNMPVPGGATYWSGGRWRYLQISDAWGNWYTCGYT